MSNKKIKTETKVDGNNEGVPIAFGNIKVIELRLLEAISKNTAETMKAQVEIARLLKVIAGEK